ncbi:unnamed protein product [Pieris macdunnoughi]|uniref:Peroxidase n=1 Tax=Pieris macdunnoughi TaxID=345717 RepID=A0A821Q782_9NEOP|nr:unnamed protein product [Pieris macdunnoughi]
MNNLYRVFVFISIFLRVNSVLFDRYSGKKVDEERAKEFRLKKYLDKCTVDIKSCAAHEVSRVSGTCNNYKHPAAGAAGRPYLRLLQPDYANQNEIRRSKTGEQLPSARKVHTSLNVATKYVLDRSNLNAAAIHFMELVRQDLSSSNGPLDSLKRNCCTEKADPRCIPIQVDNDPHLQGIHCLNFSRAETFQDLGCTHDITPAQINYQTPLLDLSLIYGVEETSQKGRLYKDGLLKSNKAGHRELPLNYNTDCFTDNGTCYTIGLPKISPLDLRTTTLAIFFLREHNRLAHALANLNPCWKDDRIFKVARQINVATASNIFMYELMPRIIGYRNMITYDLISTSNDHVTTYDVQTPPGVYAEFDIAMRFFNTFMSSKIEKYNEAYEKVGDIELNKSFLLQSLLENETNFEEINRGTFLQSATNIKNIKFPNDDPVSMDIQSGRDFALRGYNEYRDFCGLRIAMEFDDLKDIIDDEIVEVLKKVYKNVNDVDLLVGILAENNIDSTFVGPTLFCIIVKQLEILRFSNRFWFERGDNYHSFSLAQLSEIRKTNMARIACDNAEGIKYIQPNAFMSTSHWNTPVPCSHIPGLELSKWRDASCKENASTKSEKHDSNQYHFPQYTSFINDILSSMHLR